MTRETCTSIPRLLAVVSVLLLTLPAGLAQTITSPDGTWSVTFQGLGFGEIDSMDAPTSPGNVFETIWYDATPANIGGTSDRVTNNYTAVSSNVGANSASFIVRRNGLGLQLVVDVTMLDGSTGGALVELTWTNTSNATTPLKPFAYVDLDVFNKSFGDDFAEWLPAEQAIQQRDDPSGQTIWVGAVGPYEGWQLDEWPFLRNDLDLGIATLLNAGGGYVADWTAALTVDEAQLAPGGSVTISFGIGGVGFTPGGGCSGFLCGDASCDGSFNGGDIDPFFEALGNPAAWQAAHPGCDLLCLTDINHDGSLNGGDIDPFFAALGVGMCPP